MATLLQTPPERFRDARPERGAAVTPRRDRDEVGHRFPGASAPWSRSASCCPVMWGDIVHLRDIVIGAVLFVITGFGISIGYHRLFTHRGFVPKRWLKIVLATIGSFAMEGSLSGWVAAHRRHHVFSDAPGDPHSPHEFGPGVGGQLRGFVHAHVGWLFTADLTSAELYAPDLLRDSDTAWISRFFPLFAVISLAGPFFLGWGVSGTIGGALEHAAVGRARPHDAPAPRHVERELDLPHVRQAARRREGPQHQLRPAGDPVVRRVVAQLPPRASRVRPPRRPPSPDRPVRRPDPRSSSGSAGSPRCGGQPRRSSPAAPDRSSPTQEVQCLVAQASIGARAAAASVKCARQHCGADLLRRAAQAGRPHPLEGRERSAVRADGLVERRERRLRDRRRRHRPRRHWSGPGRRARRRRPSRRARCRRRRTGASPPPPSHAASTGTKRSTVVVMTKAPTRRERLPCISAHRSRRPRSRGRRPCYHRSVSSRVRAPIV